MPKSPAKSPKKSTTVKFGTAGSSALVSNEYEAIITEQTHNAQMVVSEKEIEIDRLKTTVESLNAKCYIIDDHVKDVKSAQIRFAESEVKRVELQEHIVTTSQTIEVDNSAHGSHQQQLIDQVTALQNNLEQEKQRQARKEAEWRREKDQMNADKE